MPISIQLEGTIIMRVLKMAATVKDSVSDTSFADDRIKYSLTDYAHKKDPPLHYPHGWDPKDNEVTDEDVHLHSHALAKKALQLAIVARNLAQAGSNIYVQRLEICEVKMRLSFNPVISGESSSSDESLLKGAISAVLLAIGSSFAKIDNCPLSFQAFKVNDLFASSQKYTDRIISHYTRQAIGQAYLVVGSSELLGNPVRLIRNLVISFPSILKAIIKPFIPFRFLFLGSGIVGLSLHAHYRIVHIARGLSLGSFGRHVFAAEKKRGFVAVYFLSLCCLSTGSMLIFHFMIDQHKIYNSLGGTNSIRGSGPISLSSSASHCIQQCIIPPLILESVSPIIAL